MSNSPIVLARAASFAMLLVVPTAFVFAADNAPTQQTAAPAPRQQAQALGAPAVSTNGNDVNGDDPYVTALRHEKFRAGQQTPGRFSNEPNWNGPEYGTGP